MFFLFLFFVLSVIRAHNISLTFSKILKSIDIASYIETNLITVLHIGTPKQSFLLYVSNSDLNTIFISSRIYNQSVYSPFDDLNKSISLTTKENKKQLIGNYSSDNVYFKGIEVEDLTFILLKQKNALNAYDGVIGFDINSANSNTSDIGIIDQLYSKGLISYRT